MNVNKQLSEIGITFNSDVVSLALLLYTGR